MYSFDKANWLGELKRLLVAGNVKAATEKVDAELKKSVAECNAINKVLRDLY